MNKIIERIRHINPFFCVALVILLTAGYFVLLHYFENLLPLPVFVNTKRIYLIILAIGFIALLLLLAVSKYSVIVRVVLLIFATPFCCLFSYAAIDFPEEILASADLGSYRYHITMEGMIDEPRAIYITYRCNESNLECEIIYSETSCCVDEIAIITDEKLNEVHIVRNGNLEYTDGEQPRRVLASEEYKDFLYVVGIPPVDVYPIYGSSSEKYTYSLYRCNTSFKECQKLPFGYSNTGGDIWLIINEDTNELEMYNWQSDTQDVLIFTYGVEPKCHVEQCVYPTE